MLADTGEGLWFAVKIALAEDTVCGFRFDDGSDETALGFAGLRSRAGHAEFVAWRSPLTGSYSRRIASDKWQAIQYADKKDSRRR